MATYAELYDLISDAALLKRAKVAVLVSADTVRAESIATANHTARLMWAAKVLVQPDIEAQRALMCVLAQNRAATVLVIQAATDTALQTAVDAAIDLLAVSV